ncbi:phosphotransferase family protein [Rhodococcus pseudokoreensis]|uniref:Phosphotransferase family protein n=1 Tax=Rhodococcus pseudokoreensis TaxID=2811421 RepID=A0A974W3S0_9NOCA|nr:phosphotransferase family protein [Rhodococcus pseudokoreensis]QSE90793.1 phosphotransferase family protein [Rhodococcus pseudokoreensis]
MHPSGSKVDWSALTPWLDAHSVGHGPIEDVRTLGGGTQNLLVRFQRSNTSYVLRCPAPGAGPRASAAMRREAALLSALRDTQVPHAELVASCDTEEVLGRAFYIALAVDGFSPRFEVSDALAADPEEQRKLGLAMVDALITLRDVDPVACGLVRKGRIPTGVPGQLGRLRAVFADYGLVEGWSPAELDGIEAIADRLEQTMPEDQEFLLTHGDFHMGNLIFNERDHGVEAIIDWELARVGDPLLDLGHMLCSWPIPPDPRFDGTARPMPGLPTRAEIITHYRDRTFADEGRIEWYHAYASYRLAVLLEGSHVRAMQGRGDIEVGRSLHRKAQALVEQGHAITAELSKRR